MSSLSAVSSQDQVIARIDTIIRELAALRQQLTSPVPAQECDLQEPLIVEHDGRPGLAILPAEDYRRFRQWERREKARAQILDAMAQRRAQPAWSDAFRLMDALGQRSDLSDDELNDLIDRAVHARPTSDTAS